jgi:hypothetical protein
MGMVDGDSLLLKVLKVPYDELTIDGEGFFTENGVWNGTRHYELMNVYEVGSGRLDPQTFQLKVTRRAAGAEDAETLDEVPYIEILGLDRISRTGGFDPDGQVDLNFLDSEHGVLWMPDLRPFAPDSLDLVRRPWSREVILTGEHANPDIYDRKTVQAEHIKYDLTFEFSSPQTVIRLGRFDILENSEVVTANGQRLSRGVDYTISYEMGQIELISDKARDPEADIEIGYSFLPIFGAAQKSLLGIHAVYSPGEARDKSLSTTWLYESKGAREERPKLGEEPTRNVMGDLHGSYAMTSDLLTSLVDALPGIRTDAPSRLKVSGEIALSIPNPNTSRRVYVDDMEAAEDATTIAITRRKWQFSSIPDGVPAQVGLRGDFNWFNPWNAVHEGDLSPDLPELERDDQRTVLEIRAEGTEDPGFASDGWVGVTQLISRSGLDFTRMQYLEIWVNDFRQGRDEGWKLNIDLGKVSEDAMWHPDSLPNGQLDTEDRIFPDGILDNGEDTGLDGLTSEQEEGYSASNRDPNNDDYSYSREDNPNDYSGINGYEGNDYLDTEDLNENGYLDAGTDNDYFEFTLDMSSDEFVEVDVYETYQHEPWFEDRVEPNNGWRLIRMPLSARTSVVGAPQWDAIKHVRVWLTGFTESARIQIGSIRVVGNRWQELVLRDSLDRPLPDSLLVTGEDFRVETVNNKDNRDVYVPPIRVKERQGQEDREQSISLAFTNMAPGHSGIGFKPSVRDRDFTYYEMMELFLSAPDSIGEFLDFFVRLGADSINYYEYRKKTKRDLPAGVERQWEKLKIPLRDFTSVKLVDQDSLGFRKKFVDDRTSIVVRGNPSLTKVRFMAVGVANTGDRVLPEGSVWVDEMALTNVRKNVGTAKNVTFTVNLADLGNINFAYTNLDKYFLPLGQTAWPGKDESSYNLSASVNPHRFVPWLGWAFPVSFTYSKQTSVPEFRSGTDIFLTPERRELETTSRKTYGYQISAGRISRSKNPLLKHTVDAMKTGLAVSQSSAISSTSKDTARAVKITWGYNTSFTRFAGIPLLRGEKLHLFPTNLSFNISGQSKRSLVYVRDREDLTIFYAPTARYEKTMNLDYSTQFKPLSMVSFGFSGSSNRDLAADEESKVLGFLPGGKEVSKGRGASVGFSPRLGRWFKPNINVRARYQESNTAANRTAIGADEDVRGVSNSLNQTAKWVVPIGAFTKKLAGKPAKEDTTGSGFSPVKVVRGFFRLVSRFSAVDVSMSKNRRTSYSRVFGVPSFEYQMGLTPSPGPETDLAKGATVSKDRGWSATANTRAEFTKNLNLQSQFSLEEKTRTSHAGETTTRSRTWPGLRLESRGLEQYLPITRVIKSLSLSSSYTHRYDTSMLSTGEKKGDRYDFSPLMALDTLFKNGMNAKFSTTYVKQVQKTSLGGGASNETSTTSSKHSLQVSKTIQGSKGISLPFAKSPRKLKSNLNVSAGIDYSSTLRESRTRNSKPVVNSHSDSFTLRASAGYSFSANLNGGMSMRFGQKRNIKTDRIMRSIGIDFNATFTF